MVGVVLTRLIATFYFMAESPVQLSKIYDRRFQKTSAYRKRVWQVLTSQFFRRWVAPEHTVLDLGCGYGEFINQVDAAHKYAMDLNPDAPAHLDPGVKFLHQDCSAHWAVKDQTLDVVFTSNFFEHLPDKNCLRQTLAEAHRALKPDGRLIAVGPNIRYVPGAYWDFFDHHVMLTERSLGEVLELEGFVIEQATPRFLPYTLINAPEYPLAFLRLYLRLPWLWWLKGRQFLVVARKPAT